MNKEAARLNLIDISNIFDKHDVDYFLQDGTLLGFYRDGNIFDHDEDTDMGVMHSTFNPRVFKSLYSAGFRLDGVFGYVHDSLEVGIRRNGVKTDLFFHYIRDDKQYHCAFGGPPEYNLRIDYVYDIFNTKRVNYLDYNFSVPSDELKFILTKYGEGWSTPVKVWDWAHGPKNHIQTDIVIDRTESLRQFNNWLN